MKKSMTFILSAALTFTACAPKVEERIFQPAKETFGPSSKDTKLNLRLREYGEAPPVFVWKGNVSSSQFLQTSESIVQLGDLLDSEPLRNVGLNWIEKFYDTEGTTGSLEIARSPFAGLAINQTQEQVRTTLAEVLVDIEKARPVIRDHILALDTQRPQISIEDIRGVLSLARAFTQRVLEEVPRMGLAPVIEEGLQKELVATTEPLFAEAEQLLGELYATTTLSQILALVESTVAKFKIKLDEKLLNSLKQGHGIASGLDRMNDAQSALTVLIDVWRMLTPEEQATYFKDANEELYNFLSKQDAKELECLRTEGCNGGIIDGIAKKLFILPKIKKYGVEKLRADMNKSTHDYVMSEIRQFALDFVRTMPRTFADNIDEGIVDKAQRVQRVHDAYDTYVISLFKNWQQKVLPDRQGKLMGFENPQLDISIRSGRGLSLTPWDVSPGVRGEVIGSGLSAEALLIERRPEAAGAFAHMLGQINKLVAISGYRTFSNELTPALLAPVDHKGKLLDIMNFDESKNPDWSFRIPDMIPLRDAFHADPALNYEKNFSARNFASQIRGLSRSLRLTADWKHSAMNELLGHIQAQDLTQDAEHEDLRQALFPKDMLFALNLGNVAVLLQDITKKATPVFLLSVDKNIVWADKYGNNQETSVMAGLVDIKNGKRSEVLRSSSNSHFLLAISEFLDATEGVEKTKSPILLEKDARGEAPLDVLLAGRKDLRLLGLALANFISYQLIDKTKMVVPEWSLTTMTATKGTFRVLDQALAIRALLKAWELTKIDSYLWSAQEIYYAMNRSLFNSSEEFYRNSDGSEISWAEKVETLVALQTLKPHLPAASQVQLERLCAPWIESLKNFR